MSYTLDSLLDLMIEKIQDIKMLENCRAYDELYHELLEEIKLIQEVIGIKKS